MRRPCGSSRGSRRGRRFPPQALAIREKVLGTSHAEVGATLLEYAALLRQTNRKAEAVPLERRARGIFLELARHDPRQFTADRARLGPANLLATP